LADGTDVPELSGSRGMQVVGIPVHSVDVMRECHYMFNNHDYS